MVKELQTQCVMSCKCQVIDDVEYFFVSGGEEEVASGECGFLFAGRHAAPQSALLCIDNCGAHHPVVSDTNRPGRSRQPEVYK